MCEGIREIFNLSMQDISDLFKNQFFKILFIKNEELKSKRYTACLEVGKILNIGC
jgi:hypothetical protein